MKTVITLGDMQRRGMRMLEVACRRCQRRGRLRIDKLIAEHGRDGTSSSVESLLHYPFGWCIGLREKPDPRRHARNGQN
jgi:hypothetical protein